MNWLKAKNSFHYALILVGFCLLFQDLQAQTPQEVIRQVYQNFSQRDEIATDLQVNYFENLESVKPVRTQAFKIRKQGSTWFYDLGDRKMISDGDVTLLINGQDQTIHFFDVAKSKKQKKQPEMVPGIEDVNAPGLVLKHEGDDGRVYYSFPTTNNRGINLYLYLNEAEELPTRAELYYDQEIYPALGRVVIEYHDREMSASSKELKMASYLRKKGGKYEGVNTYRNYQIIVHHGA